MRTVEGGFFTSLFGDSVFAKNADLNTENYAQTATSSQSMTLLQANASPTSILGEKDTKNDKKNGADKSIDSSLDINIVADTSLFPAVGPSGVSDGKDAPDSASGDTSVYVVRNGDTISQIADMFGVSANTILWANDMKKGDKLVKDDVLVILPVSGVEHTVAKGQTLQSIAKLYKANTGDVALFNGLSEDAKLAIGDKLIIPDGEMADEGGDKPAPNLKATEVKDKNYYATSLLKGLIGYFINPLPTGHKTQGLHGSGKRGIDIGAPTGTNVYTSAEGIVIAVKTGCKVGQSRCGGGYGNMAIIQHSNGTKTLYGHMSKVLISAGTQIAQGQVIGLVGSTGHSTGPHLHFEVFNAKNPGADWSWAH